MVLTGIGAANKIPDKNKLVQGRVVRPLYSLSLTNPVIRRHVVEDTENCKIQVLFVLCTEYCPCRTHVMVFWPQVGL